MTITGNLSVKQPFLGIEVAPNNDFLFWGEKKFTGRFFCKNQIKTPPKSA